MGDEHLNILDGFGGMLGCEQKGYLVLRSGDGLAADRCATLIMAAGIGGLNELWVCQWYSLNSNGVCLYLNHYSSCYPGFGQPQEKILVLLVIPMYSWMWHGHASISIQAGAPSFIWLETMVVPS